MQDLEKEFIRLNDEGNRRIVVRLLSWEEYKVVGRGQGQLFI